MSARYTTCRACGTDVPVARPAGLRELPGEMDENVIMALQEHASSCAACVITWEDLAEQQEMVAKAWAKRASADKTPRIQRATLDDAADAAGQAKVFRLAHGSGSPINQGLAVMLSVTR